MVYAETMKLPWKGDKGPAGPLTKIRAAVMPLALGQGVIFNAKENNFTVNSISTHVVDLQPLQPGQSAADVAPFAPGTVNQGGAMISKEDAAKRGIQRAQFDAPNWVNMLVASQMTVYERNIDIPVWVDASGKIQSVDVETMLAELEPLRQRASEVWGQEEGVFSDLHQIAQAPKKLFGMLKTVAAVPGELVSMVKDIKAEQENQAKPADPVPAHFQPDLSQHPPIDGMDYPTFITLLAKPETATELGFEDEPRRLAAFKAWGVRVNADWKLSSLYSSDLDRMRKGASPSWEQ